MRRMLLVVTAAMVMALTMVAMAVPVFAGGEGDDEDSDNQSASGGSTRNGQIVFRRWLDPDQTKGALFTMNPDGSHIRQITHPPEGWRDDDPVWSPDGQQIVFNREKSDESTSRIMVVNPDTGDERQVIRCTGRCVQDLDPTFSPDGDSVAFNRQVRPRIKGKSWKTPIFIVGLDGSDPHQLTETPKPHAPPAGPLDNGEPAISPDGKMLGFIRTRYEPEESTAIFVQPIDSPGDVHQLTPWKLNCQERPEFSPDGKLMLFRCLPKGEEG